MKAPNKNTMLIAKHIQHHSISGGCVDSQVSTIKDCQDYNNMLYRMDHVHVARKRKLESGRREKRVVLRTWDTDDGITSELLEDMGVSRLASEEDEETELESWTGPKLTPLNPTQHPELIATAPKVIVVPNPFMNVSFGPYGNLNFRPYCTVPYIEPQGTTDSFLFKRSQAEVVYGHDYWSDLSDEIILEVFKWLPKSRLVRNARVCRRWSRLCLDESLWRRLDLANKVLKRGVVGRVLNRGVAVLRLAKSQIMTPLFAENNHVFNQPRFVRVQYLDLSMAVLSTSAMEQLLGSCHLLRKLSLENCQLNDQICRYIGQNANLEVLNLSMCQGITENGLVPICNNLQRLESLNIAWSGMTRGAVVYLVTCLSASLCKLNLSGCRDSLLDEDVHQLCRSCPGLKELDLSDAAQLTRLTVEHIASLLHGLEYIALSRCYHLMPSSLPMLGSIATLLALDVFGMLKEIALLQLKNAMPNIAINKFPFSSIARPTTGLHRTSIWGLRVRDSVV